MPDLPSFLSPMLADKAARPFDSEHYVFEVKWDGTRALAFVAGGDYRLRNRRDRDLRQRYPELAFLRRLPEGCILDGEVVVLREGRPDFEAMLRREQARQPEHIVKLAAELPAFYAVFDLPWHGGEPILQRPLRERRERLQRLVAAASEPRLLFSEGVVGNGTAFFAEVQRRGLEGIVAKRLDSPYLPGRRSSAWQKVKALQRLHCVVIGFVPEPGQARGFKSLIVATDDGGELRCVGRVGSGIGDAERRRLDTWLWSHLRAEPIVDCGPDVAGRWVEPELYCTVSFLERTRDGMLRAPVFLGLVEG